MKRAILLLVFFPTATFAQLPFEWPADTAQAQRMWVLFTDAIRNQDYSDGLAPFQWLQRQAPDLNPALYIQGEKLFKGLVTTAEDSAKKATYQQQELELYDQRMQHFPQEKSVMNRKAYAAYQYYRENPGRYQELLSIYEEAFRSPQPLTEANLIAFMDVLRRYRAAGGTSFSDEEVLNYYDKISRQLQQQVGPKAEEKQALLDKLLLATVAMDCAKIEDKFGTPFLRDTMRLDRAKRVLALALTYQCSAAPFFLTALRVVHRHEPTVGTARTLAKLYEAREETAVAEGYWKQAIDLSSEGPEQATLWYTMAQYYQRANRKPQARQAAQKAMQQDATISAEAYKLIGDLYFSSFEECKEGQRVTQDRAVYWAAYEMYQRAKRPDLMEQSQQQFPTMEQIFQEGLAEGETLSVGCWINKTVTVRRRPSSP